jgi:hypothetical protein
MFNNGKDVSSYADSLFRCVHTSGKFGTCISGLRQSLQMGSSSLYTQTSAEVECTNCHVYKPFLSVERTPSRSSMTIKLFLPIYDKKD